MSISLFRASEGISIELDDLSAEASLLIGIGIPGGDGNVQDAAAIGSTYQQTDAEADNLQFYVKVSTAADSPADWRVLASKSYVDSAIAGLQWRDPARVMDKTVYADVAAFPVTGIIDGITLNPDDRVLFANVTGDPENVYIWDGSAWTEDIHPVADGDALLVLEGTSADEHYTYNGTDWVQIGSSENSEEIDFIRAFIGKDSVGIEMPNYTSTDNISQNSTLEAAIGVLDDVIGDRTYSALNITSGNDVAVSLENLNVAIGDRAYLTPNIITANEAVGTSLVSLDTAIGDRDYVDGNVLTDSETVTASLDSLSVAIGDRDYVDGNVVTDGDTITVSIDGLSVAIGDRTYTEQNIITDGETITNSINALDVAIRTLDNQSQESSGSGENASSGIIIDTVPLVDATEIKWIVQVRDSGTPGNRRALEVHAMNDGGTSVDHTQYAILKLGSAIAGFKIDVVINAGNMELELTVPTISIDYVVKRVSYSAF